jgi:hypothetical protein
MNGALFQLDLDQTFQPYQIVYLEHQCSRVYAEVIQVVPQRSLCWARPLALLTQSEGQRWSDGEGTLYDLREGSDLLYPASLFQVALDVEVIPLMVRLQGMQLTSESRRKLHGFIQQLCQANPQAFSKKTN